MTSPKELAEKLRGLAKYTTDIAARYAMNEAADMIDQLEDECVKRHEDVVVMYDRAMQAEEERDKLRVHCEWLDNYAREIGAGVVPKGAHMELLRERDKYREALEWYAGLHGHILTTLDEGESIGARARAALKETE